MAAPTNPYLDYASDSDYKIMRENGLAAEMSYCAPHTGGMPSLRNRYADDSIEPPICPWGYRDSIDN